MAKRLTLLAMALVAVAAFAVPAAASAAKATMPEGTLVAKNTIITATSSNAKTVTALGTLTCESVMVEAKITKNDGSTVEATGNAGAGNTTSNCKLGETPITIDNPAVTSLLANSTTKTVGLSFTGTIGVTCTFAGTVPFTLPVVGGVEVSQSETIIPSGTVSGGCGEAKFSGEFKLETTTAAGGGAVLVDR